MLYRKHLLKILIYLSLFSSFIFIFVKLNPAIGEDEPFTLALINHSFGRMIYISSFDVHPPLYYIILKSFIIITTFWTSSILIKIVAAKLFSVLCFIITFIALYKLLKYLKIFVDWKIQLILYLLILSTVNFSLQIRMYEMATMSISIELLYLVKFIINKNTRCLIVAIIFAIISSYTHYFAAMFAGSLLVVFFFKEIKNNKIRVSKKIFLGGLVFALSFIPCIKFALFQLKYTASSNYSNNPGNFKLENFLPIDYIEAIAGENFNNYLEAGFGCALAFLICYFTIKNINNLNNNVFNILIDLMWVMILSLIFPTIFSILKHPLIQGRYFYPIVSIYEFILISIILKNYKYIHYDIVYYGALLITLIIMSLAMLGKSFNQVRLTDITSFNSFITVSRLNKSNKRDVYLNGNKYNMIQGSIYMNNFHKHPKIIVKDLNIKNTLGSNNIKLANNVFSDINIVDNKTNK